MTLDRLIELFDDPDTVEDEMRAAIKAYAAEQVAAEREACAVIADRTVLGSYNGEQIGAYHIAAAIRARAQEE